MANPPTSIYTGILNSVKARIVSLSLPNASVIIRKLPVIGVDDELPLILISPEKEVMSFKDNRGINTVDYPVMVTIAIAGNQLLERNVTQLLDWREAIRFELDAVQLSGAPTVIDCNVELNPPFDFPRYKAELDASAIRFIFRSSEAWKSKL